MESMLKEPENGDIVDQHVKCIKVGLKIKISKYLGGKLTNVYYKHVFQNMIWIHQNYVDLDSMTVIRRLSKNKEK